MTTPLSVNATILAATPPSAKLIRSDGRVGCQHDQYAWTTSEVAGSVLQTGIIIPANAVYLKTCLSFTVAQGSSTFAIGDGTTADLFALAALQNDVLLHTLHNPLTYTRTPLALPKTVYVTIAAATATAATMFIQVYYLET